MVTGQGWRFSTFCMFRLFDLIIRVIVASQCQGSRLYSRVTYYGNVVSLNSSEGRNGERSNNLGAVIRALGGCDTWLEFQYILSLVSFLLPVLALMNLELYVFSSFLVLQQLYRS